LGKNENHYKNEIKSLKIKIDKDSKELVSLKKSFNLIQKQFKDLLEEFPQFDRAAFLELMTNSNEYAQMQNEMA